MLPCSLIAISAGGIDDPGLPTHPSLESCALRERADGLLVWARPAGRAALRLAAAEGGEARRASPVEETKAEAGHASSSDAAAMLSALDGILLRLRLRLVCGST